MITYPEFQDIVIEHLNRKIGPDDNPDQNLSISAPIGECQFLVAGPGLVRLRLWF